MPVLYVRTSEPIAQAVKALAASTGLSITAVVDELLGRGLGIGASPSFEAVLRVHKQLRKRG